MSMNPDGIIRKVVHWVHQGVVEYWQHDTIHGWRLVSRSEADDWKPGTFEAHRMCASQESFATRKYGKIVMVN